MSKNAKGKEHIEPSEYLLRYKEFYSYEGKDENSVGDGEEGVMYVCLKLRKLLIHSKTASGVWVYNSETPIYRGNLRFVLFRRGNTEPKKKFAYYKESDALKSYIYRKRRQIFLLGETLERAKIGLRQAEHKGEQ